MNLPEDDKKKIREEVLARRKKGTTPQRVLKSADILQKLFELEIMAGAKWLHFYCSAGSEVETSGMIAHAIGSGLRVSVPWMDVQANHLVLSEVLDPTRDLSPNLAGIPEPKEDAFRPVSLEAMDLFVIPGVAFDEKGGRLGKGKGYYDRLLSSMAGRKPVVALAFESQMVPEVPMEEHDIRVDWVITEKRSIECRNGWAVFPPTRNG